MDDCALYADPQLYDLLFPDARSTDSLDPFRRERLAASERFYLAEARRAKGRILEMACGSGRLTIPLAQAGIDIAGADLAPAMLDAARAKARAAGLSVPFFQADMRRFDLPGLFGAIFLPGNSLLHLHTVADLRDALLTLRRHLASGGRLVFDVANCNAGALVPDSRERSLVRTVIHPQRGEITVEETSSYDAALQIRAVTWYFSAPGAPDFRVLDYRLRVIFPQELSLLLESAGFLLEARYGELTREPFVSSSPRQVCICLPRP